ncbi:MAG: Eco57I restriction-modification methylase domain-containing protein [Promethearchaeota archaeon]
MNANLGAIQEQIRAKSLSPKEIQTFFSPNTQSEQSRDQKQFGIFYTPPAIAQYFLLHTLQKDFKDLHLLFLTTLRIHDYGTAMGVIEKLQNIKILDPACGSGIFLIHALRCLYQNWLMIQNDWKTHTPIPQEIRTNWDDTQKNACKFLQKTLMIHAYTPQKLLLGIILRQLYGVDINVDAIIETQVNLCMEVVRLAPESYLPLDRTDHDVYGPFPDISLNFSCGNAIVTLPNHRVLPILEAQSSSEIQDLIKLRENYIAQHSDQSDPSDPSEKSLPSLIETLRINLQKKLLEGFEPELKENGLFEVMHRNGSEQPIFWEIQFAHVFFSKSGQILPEAQRGFSYVLGNPPYIHQKGTKDAPKIGYDHRTFFRHYYPSVDSSDLTTHGGVKMNIFILFLEQSVRLLRLGGTIAFLIHKNFLTVESYQKSRKYLLDHTRILEIVDAGAQVFPQITGEIIFFITQKNTMRTDSPSQPQLIHIIPSILLSKNYKIAPKSQHFTPQNLFLSPPNYVFHLHLSPKNVEIRKIITENSQSLSHYVNISSYGLNVKRQFISTSPKEGWVPAIRGKQIARYLIKTPLWILYTPESLTRPGNVKAFTAPEKLVMQRIGGKFAAAYDDHQLYAFNSVNMILPLSPPTETTVPLKFLLAIINSTLIRYYIQKFFTMDAAFTINITKGFLETLPIPACSPSIQDKVVKLASTLEQNQQLMNGGLSPADLSRTQRDNKNTEKALDMLIFDLFGLNSSQISTIHSQLQRY